MSSRIAFALWIILISPCLAIGQGSAAPLAYGYVGLFIDENHAVCSFTCPGGFCPFTLWIWWYPYYSTGMRTAEFAISYPSIVIPTTVVTNPGISESVGSLADGMHVTFAQCQTGWVWTHNQACFVTSSDPAWVELVAHPASGMYGFGTCEPGNPIAPAAILNQLALAQPCWWEDPQPIRLFRVAVRSASAIRAVFNQCVQSDILPRYFVLRNAADAADSIGVAQATWRDGNEYDLVLERAMTDSTTYILLARSTDWSCLGGISSSEIGFTFIAATATQPSSWGAIKALFRG